MTSRLRVRVCISNFMGSHSNVGRSLDGKHLGVSMYPTQ